MTATAPKLYEIADDYQAVVSALEENGGELTPELAAQLDAIQDAFRVKVERVGLYLQNLDGLATAAKRESMRLSDLAAKRDRAVDALKAYLKREMERVGELKIETPLVSARIQRNSQPSVTSELTGEAIPEPYRRVSVELNKGAVVAAWKSDPSAVPAGITVSVGTHLRLS